MPAINAVLLSAEQLRALTQFRSEENAIMKALTSPTLLVYCPHCDQMVEVDRKIADTKPWRTDVFRWPQK